MTAFVALLTMDANRQKAGRLDWCCCFTSGKTSVEKVRRAARSVEVVPSFSTDMGAGNKRRERAVEKLTSIEAVEVTMLVLVLAHRYSKSIHRLLSV